MKIRVLIADQSYLVSDSIRATLAEEEDIQVIGCAADEVMLFTLLPQCDVALINAQFKGSHTVDLIETVHEKYDGVKFIALRVPNWPAEIVRFIEVGVIGYILEEDDTEDLVEKVRAAAEDRAVVSDKVAAAMMKHINQLAKSPSILYEQHKQQVALLTPRQREVLALVSEGMTNQEIALRLYIQRGTVKNHLHHILKKIGASNRHEAAAMFQLSR